MASELVKMLERVDEMHEIKVVADSILWMNFCEGIEFIFNGKFKTSSQSFSQSTLSLRNKWNQISAATKILFTKKLQFRTKENYTYILCSCKPIKRPPLSVCSVFIVFCNAIICAMVTNLWHEIHKNKLNLRESMKMLRDFAMRNNG